MIAGREAVDAARKLLDERLKVGIRLSPVTELYFRTQSIGATQPVTELYFRTQSIGATQVHTLSSQLSLLSFEGDNLGRPRPDWSILMPGQARELGVE
jgi:hypothetical protein